MSKFIEKAIEMQECCLRGNVKRNPKERKETAERNFCQSCTICCLTGKRIEVAVQAVLSMAVTNK